MNEDAYEHTQVGSAATLLVWIVYHDFLLPPPSPPHHTYTPTGHGKAVRDVSFNRDGSQFLSCGYDRYIKLWDTETGQLSPYK